MQVSVLFTKKNSVYEKLKVECYNKERNALSFTGSDKVVCHPPCEGWGRLRKFSKKTKVNKALALWAIDIVRKNGGVLEHPRNSTLFKHYLPLPGQRDEWGGFSLAVSLHQFGAIYKKESLIYICGCTEVDLPDIPLNFNAIERTIASSRKKKNTKHRLKELSSARRNDTPLLMAEWLIKVATSCQV